MRLKRPGWVAAESLGPLTELGSGGQGAVHAVGGQPVVYKEYNAETRQSLDEDVLEAMVGFVSTLPGPVAAAIRMRAAWPVRVVGRAGRVCGFLMPRVPPAFVADLRMPTGRARRPAQVQYLLNDDRYLAGRGLAIDDVFRLEVLCDTAAALALFHSQGIAVGDLSPNNLLFSRSRRPRCLFLDCDAMRVLGASALPQAETVDWEVPTPAEELATPASDSYKFTLLCIRLMAGDQSTRAAGSLAWLGADVAALAERGLDPDPARRPDAAQWGAVLAVALDRQRRRRPRMMRPVAARPRWLRLAALIAVGAVLLFFLATRLSGCAAGMRTMAQHWTGERAQGAEQASGVAQVISGSGRVPRLASCRDARTAGAALHADEQVERASVERAGMLEVDLLPRGAELKQQLISAYQHAAQSDVAYARWAAAVGRDGCGSAAMTGPDRRRGDREAAAAIAARKRVVALWNPLAAEYGYPQRTYQEI